MEQNSIKIPSLDSVLVCRFRLYIVGLCEYQDEDPQTWFGILVFQQHLPTDHYSIPPTPTQKRGGTPFMS